MSFIYFVENPGFAFGMKFGGVFDRITHFFNCCFFFIAIYKKIIKRDAPLDVVIGLSAILLGAMGNIIDSAFYGVLFGESTFGTVAEFCGIRRICSIFTRACGRYDILSNFTWHIS